MRIPNMSRVRKNDFDDRQYEIKRIKNYTPADGVSYDFTDEKTKVSFIMYIEKIVRSSIEYAEFIKFLKEKLELNRCTYFKNISKSDFKNISIEIHHSPFTLFEICSIAFNKFIDEGMTIDVFRIANYVMFTHFSGDIGLVPLTKTVHELVHESQIFIPISSVYGDVGKYYMENREYMTEVQKETLLKNINATKELEEAVPHVLKKKFIYLDVEGMTLPKLL